MNLDDGWPEKLEHTMWHANGRRLRFVFGIEFPFATQFLLRVARHSAIKRYNMMTQHGPSSQSSFCLIHVTNSWLSASLRRASAPARAAKLSKASWFRRTRSCRRTSCCCAWRVCSKASSKAFEILVT